MAETLRAGTVLQDTYRVLRRVGEGGMGEVYEAAHIRLPGRFAIKLLLREVAANAEAFARFQREAQITSALRHPNIVQVVDFNKLPDGSPYIVMEFLDGRDLAGYLQHRRPTLPETIAIIEQIASGLAAAHSQGVVHRDLKPQNVYIVPVVGQKKVFAKIVDFGISKVKAGTKNLTREAAVMGTPQYMSPEQALGRGAEVDARTDQFALGAIAYEMLTGREAFSGESLPALLYQVVHEEPLAMNLDAPAASAIEAVVRRGLSKKKETRFPTVLEFAEALAVAAGVTGRMELTPAPVTVTGTDATVVGPAPTAPTPVTEPDADQGTQPFVERPTSGESAGKPTTFNATASEMANPEVTARFRRRLAAGGGAAAALVVALVLVGTRSKPPTPLPRQVPVVAASQPQLPVTVPTVQAIEGLVPVNVVGAPPGLEVKVDGRPGALPVNLTRGSGAHTLRFEAPGYRPKEITVGSGTAQTITLEMQRLRSRDLSAASAMPERMLPQKAPDKPWVDPFAGPEPLPKRAKPAVRSKEGRILDL